MRRQHQRASPLYPLGELQCPHCNYITEVREDLFAHIRRRHQGEEERENHLYHCPDCTYKTASRPGLRKHRAKKHSRRNMDTPSPFLQVESSQERPVKPPGSSAPAHPGSAGSPWRRSPDVEIMEEENSLTDWSLLLTGEPVSPLSPNEAALFPEPPRKVVQVSSSEMVGPSLLDLCVENDVVPLVGTAADSLDDLTAGAEVSPLVQDTRSVEVAGTPPGDILEGIAVPLEDAAIPVFAIIPTIETSGEVSIPSLTDEERAMEVDSPDELMPTITTTIHFPNGNAYTVRGQLDQVKTTEQATQTETEPERDQGSDQGSQCDIIQIGFF